MDRLSGVLVVLAGTAFGAYIGLPEPGGVPYDISGQVPRIAAPEGVRTATGLAPVRTVTIADAEDEESAIRRVRVFSPSEPLMAAVDAATFTPAARPQHQWTAVVKPSTNADTAITSPRAGDAKARAALASDLQRELQRVGCYGGEINGGWTTSTRHAMQTFMDRVNASLPIDEPDFILLTLVQGHKGQVCGATCPRGQAADTLGRCMPEAVLASAPSSAGRSQALSAEKDRNAALQERLAAESRAARSKRAARLAAAASKHEVLPWRERPGTTATPSPRYASIQPTARTDALPGRMSVGGPLPAAGDSSGSVAAAEAPFPVPAPRPAVRPRQLTREAALQPGFPGTKSGVAGRSGLPGGKAGPAAFSKKKLSGKARNNKDKYSSKSKKRRYTSGFGGKGRRYQPRMGTARYNVMMSLGGIY